ncbi:MAG: Ig-like domain-containing protein [Desulfobacteraceae bacterium]|nr:Ig-like domain-containing protein [Desulfobacteraceae bacterium]
MRNIRVLCICLAAILLLAACNSDEQTADYSSWQKAGLYYAYPYDGQKEVPLHAPVVLRFSEPVTSENPQDHLTWTDADGQSVDFSVQVKQGGRSLVLIPDDGDDDFEPRSDDALSPATQYVVSAGDLETEIGGAQFPEGGISFTTRAAVRGAGDRITADEDYVTQDAPFQVARMVPDGQDLQFVDFSTIRLQFTQPVDKSTVKYGETVVLEDDQGNVVEANVIASGSYMTIDPEAAYLDPSKLHHLRLNNGLKSIAGIALDPGYYNDLVLQPRNSASSAGQRSVLVQKAPASDGAETAQCTENCTYTSPLTGMPINCVPMKAKLLGHEGNNTQQTGDVHAELAYAPDYPDVTPLRIPRGSLLKGTNMQVNIGGLVPAGYETGDISVKFVSDASGYLMPNPYSDDTDAPRQIRLYMDIAMNTAGAKANGGLSQDLLHVELVGTSIVEDGVMVINAVGVIEPRVLGLEEAYGILSFRMESYRDQVNAPAMAEDMVAPAVQSWLPGSTENAKSLRPGDPIIVNFTEPLDRNSIQQAVDNNMLTVNGGTDFQWSLDGASLVIRPDDGLAYGTTYDLSIPSTSVITDVAGNSLDSDRILSFTMPDYVEKDNDGNGNVDYRSPIVLTAYPGYPCVNTVGMSGEVSPDADGDLCQGRCAGGLSSDDDLPVMGLPANRAIVVKFSQVMDTDSIVAGSSFVVQRSDDGGSTWSAVEGRLEKHPRKVYFHPETPWQDGVLYRYILASGEADPQLSGIITDFRGHPLQTQILSQPAGDNTSTAPGPTDGGPPLVNYFHGAPATDAVFQILRNLPTIDVNSNYIYDGRRPADDESGCTDETCEDVSDPEPGYIVEENATKIIADADAGGATAKTGCPFGETCPDKKFIWLTAALNVEVVGLAEYEGFGSYTGQAVKVHIFPTRLMTSNLDVYAEVLTMELHNPSGPQIMRMRYEADDEEAEENPTQPITGWIRPDADGDPIFETELNLYLDAPYLEPSALGIILGHNLHSYRLDGLKLRGDITFFDDGRMNIEQISTTDMPIDITVGGLITIHLQIPEGGAFMNYIQSPLKE